jgi:hypothetical protein
MPVQPNVGNALGAEMYLVDHLEELLQEEKQKIQASLFFHENFLLVAIVVMPMGRFRVAA